MSTSFFVVTCPCGEEEYPVDPGKVPDEGVHARCSRCSTVFLVERPRWASQAFPGAGGGVAAASSEAHDAEVFDAYFEPVYPDDGVDPAAPFTAATAVPETAKPGPVPHGPLSPPVAAPRDPGVGLRVEVEVDAPSRSSPGGAFGRRDPHDKARRLARVLVSDMITYHRDRHSRALAAGTLPEDFDEEIRKSWEEYVLQVGRELAEGTTYFRDALNDILAGGRDLF